MKKIGIFSGSFDPVHEGHTAFAKEAMRVCGLDTIVFLPERFPRGKPKVTPIRERITELEIALAKTPFSVLDLPDDQFTIDKTIPKLRALYPESTFTFLVGSDVALNLPKWRGINYLAKHSNFAIGIRSNTPLIKSTLDEVGIHYTVVTTKHKRLSSSVVRKDQQKG